MPPLPPDAPLFALFGLYKRCRLRGASSFTLRVFRDAMKAVDRFTGGCTPIIADLTPSTIDAVAAWLARERHADALEVDLFRDHMGKLMRFARAMQRPTPSVSTLAVFTPDDVPTITSDATLPVTFTGSEVAR